MNISPAALLRISRQQTSLMVETLKQLVELESPSTDPASLDRIAQFVARWLQQQEIAVEQIPVQGSGPIVRARVGAGPRPVMLLGHLDTVWPVGTLEQRPVRVEQGRLYGPGAFDMKGGVTVALYALHLIRTLHLVLPRGAVLLLTPLEEVGSDPYRELLEDEARHAHCVLVLEPPMPGGAAKTSRKGVGRVRMRIRGRAAHSGLAPEAGVSAICELAHQILALEQLNNIRPGITINVGVVRGGLRANVVADEAEAQIDVRFDSLVDGQEVISKIFQRTPVLPGAHVEFSGGIAAPPLVRTERVVALYEHARTLAEELGFQLPEAAAGGASEGCYTAAVGTPTLDGLGPDGDGAHAVDEHVLIASLPQRVALLVQMLLTL